MRQSHKLLFSVYKPIQLEHKMTGERTAEEIISSDIELEKLKFTWNDKHAFPVPFTFIAGLAMN